MTTVVTTNGKTAQALVEANWAKQQQDFAETGYQVLDGQVSSRNWRTNTPNNSAPKKSGLLVPASVGGNWTIEYEPDPLDLSGANATVQRLTVTGSKIKQGASDFVIKGFSLLYPDCYYQNFSGVQRCVRLASNFPDFNTVRVPCYPDGADINYGVYGLTNYLTWFVDPIVRWCERNGKYCIIDWHSTGTTWDSAPIDTALKAFWDVVAARYKDLPHVIYEMYNEPDGPNNGFAQSSWDNFKSQCQTWVNYIRAIAPNTLILAPTPAYTQFVRYVPSNPLTGSNIAYTFHVYPGHFPGGSVKDWTDADVAPTTLQTKLDWCFTAFAEASQTIPVVITEWGYALTDVGFYLLQAKSRRSFAGPLNQQMEAYGVSWTSWSLDPSGGPAMLATDTTLNDFGDKVSTVLSGDGMLPLRIAETQGRVITNWFSAGGSNTRAATYQPAFIPYPVKTLATLMQGWVFKQYANGYHNLPNAFTVEKMWIECPNGNIILVTWAGGRTKLVSPGDNDIVSDEILPTAAGYTTEFPAGTYIIKTEISFTSGGSIPFVQNSHNVVSHTYVGASTTLTADTAGPLVYTGTAPSSPGNVGFKPILLGRQSTERACFIGLGDSISDGAVDGGTNSIYGIGFMQRAMGNNGTNAVPCLGFYSHGVRTWLYKQEEDANIGKWVTLLKYANHAVVELSTNDIGVYASNILEADMKEVWNILRAAQIESITQVPVLAFTSSTDNWATSGNQTAAANWGAATSRRSTFNAMLTTELALETIDYIVNTSTVLDSTDTWKWKTNGSAKFVNDDDVHPNTNGHALLATALRAVINEII
jgi:lysophospholipase L1-like esterase